MKNIFNTLDKKDKIIFLTEAWLLVSMAMVWFYLVSNNIKPTSFSTGDCFWYTHWGLYCPGCGGTRAFESMLYGHFIKSFIYHPFVLYVVLTLFISFLSYIVYFITRGNKMFFKLKLKHLVYADLIFIIFFLFRNILAIYLGIYLY